MTTLILVNVASVALSLNAAREERNLRAEAELLFKSWQNAVEQQVKRSLRRHKFELIPSMEKYRLGANMTKGDIRVLRLQHWVQRCGLSHWFSRDTPTYFDIQDAVSIFEELEDSQQAEHPIIFAQSQSMFATRVLVPDYVFLDEKYLYTAKNGSFNRDCVSFRGRLTGGEVIRNRRLLMKLMSQGDDFFDVKVLRVAEHDAQFRMMKHLLETARLEPNTSCRYQLDIDGHGATYKAFAWQLKSQGVTLKLCYPHFIEWWYNAVVDQFYCCVGLGDASAFKLAARACRVDADLKAHFMDLLFPVNRTDIICWYLNLVNKYLPSA